ncbi:coilin isoform 1-T1 [Rhinophrynus dorsalis]
MAAPCSVRVRLQFDYPPPAIPESCMFWLLVDVKRCRVVADLASIIRQRFLYGQRGGLSLYVEECLLPPGESILVIRDNDCIRVKWDETYSDDGVHSKNNDHQPKKSKKRHWQNCEGDDDRLQTEKRISEPDPKSLSASDVRKKRKKESISVHNYVPDEQPKKSTRKRQKEKVREKTRDKPSPVKPSLKTRTSSLTSVNSVAKRKSSSESSSSNSPSSSDHDPRPTTCQKKASEAAPAATKRQEKPCAGFSLSDTVSPRVGNAACSGKSTRKDTSSSSSVSGCDGEVVPSTAKSRTVPTVCTLSAEGTSQKKHPPSSSDSDTFIIKRTETSSLAQPALALSLISNGDVVASERVQPVPLPDIKALGRGVGRGCGGRDDFTWRGQRGRWFRGRGDDRNRGRGGKNSLLYLHNTETRKQQFINEVSTNSSVIIQNPQDAPRKDYSALPLLAAPPQTGKIIAFKLLELTENYTPDVSDYKGKCFECTLV